MASVKRWELSEVTHTMYHRDGGKWALYDDIAAVVKEAYENGKKEGERQEVARVARYEHICTFYV